jgi:hypothetical protein
MIFPLVVFINSSISCYLINTISNFFNEGNAFLNILQLVIFIKKNLKNMIFQYSIKMR